MEYIAPESIYTKPTVMSQILKHWQNISCMFPRVTQEVKQVSFWFSSELNKDDLVVCMANVTSPLREALRITKTVPIWSYTDRGELTLPKLWPFWIHARIDQNATYPWLVLGTAPTAQNLTRTVRRNFHN